MKKSGEMRIGKIYVTVSLFVLMFVMQCQMILAADLVGNASTWILGQATSIVIIVTIIGIVGALIRKAYIAAVTAGIVGAIVTFITSNPDNIKNLGETLGSMILGS